MAEIKAIKPHIDAPFIHEYQSRQYSISNGYQEKFASPIPGSGINENVQRSYNNQQAEGSIDLYKEEIKAGEGKHRKGDQFQDIQPC